MQPLGNRFGRFELKPFIQLDGDDRTGSSVQGELWLRLRKTSGYASKIELAQFGSYDNPNAVGS